MDHDMIHAQEDVDDLISDIHQLIDDDVPSPSPEEVPEEAPAPEEAPQPEETPAPVEAPPAPVEEEKPQAHWTDRQRVPKHVAKLQNNQEEAYARWLQEQEEKGEEAPPVFEEELPKKKKKKDRPESAPVEASGGTAVAVHPKKKRTFAAWFSTLLVLVTLAVIVTAVFVIPQRPLAEGGQLHCDGASAILLAGTDDSLGRTDMLMMMTVNTAKGTVALVSIPKDTAVQTQDGIVSIGSVYGRAGGGNIGIAALKAAVADCMGFVPDGCLVLYPEAVTAFMDILGGEISGEDALELLCARGEAETLDLTRLQTQRQFLADVISDCKDFSSVLKAPLLLDALCANGVTDLDTSHFLWLAKAALCVDSANAELTTLPGEAAENARYILNEELLVQSVNAYCNPYVRAVSAGDLRLPALSGEE